MVLDKDKNAEAMSFHTWEHEFLHNEISKFATEARNLERLAIIASAVIWTWLATNWKGFGAPELIWTWWTPFALTLFAVFRAWALLRRIQQAADYLMLIESRLPKLEGLPGWRTYFEKKGRKYLTITSGIFWITLLLVTGITPLLVI